MNIRALVEKFRESDDFVVLEPCGLPEIKGIHKLPKDVVEFYELCGGVVFSGYGLDDEDGPFPLNILPPNEVKSANLELIGEICEYDITSDWYLIVNAWDGNYISIDFDINRNGKCYDSFFDRHGIRECCPVVARSFTELLESIINYRGEENFFWLDKDFLSLGDAYDGIPE